MSSSTVKTCEQCGQAPAAFAYGGADLNADIEDGAAVWICESCAGQVVMPLPANRSLARITIAHGKVFLT